MKKYAIFILALTVGAAAGLCLRHISAAQVFSEKTHCVVVDAGHGAPDGGAVGVNGTVEKDVNLAISQRLREVLEARGVRVVMTRDGDNGLWTENDKTIRQMKVTDMHKRRDIMENSDADLFLSIHLNSFADSRVNGLHIFYSKNHGEIEELAESIQDKIAGVTGAETHAVKTADESLFLMKNPPIPAILVECGFISNPDEEAKLNDEEYQAKIAWAVANSVADYYEIP